jgi:hypothetical protein
MPRSRRRAVALTELLVIAGVLVVLVGLLFTAVRKVRAAAQASAQAPAAGAEQRQRRPLQMPRHERRPLTGSASTQGGRLVDQSPQARPDVKAKEN